MWLPAFYLNYIKKKLIFITISKRAWCMSYFLSASNDAVNTSASWLKMLTLLQRRRSMKCWEERCFSSWSYYSDNFDKAWIPAKQKSLKIFFLPLWWFLYCFKNTFNTRFIQLTIKPPRIKGALSICPLLRLDIKKFPAITGLPSVSFQHNKRDQHLIRERTSCSKSCISSWAARHWKTKPC